MAHFLKARIVEAEKQLLLGNGPYTNSRGMCHTTIKGVPSSILWVHAALTATQLCSKHIFAALNQTAKKEEQAFSVGAILRLFIEDLMQLERELSFRVCSCSEELS
jgi:hypothetical protein